MVQFLIFFFSRTCPEQGYLKGSLRTLWTSSLQAILNIYCRFNITALFLTTVPFQDLVILKSNSFQLTLQRLSVLSVLSNSGYQILCMKTETSPDISQIFGVILFLCNQEFYAISLLCSSCQWFKLLAKPKRVSFLNSFVRTSFRFSSLLLSKQISTIKLAWFRFSLKPNTYPRIMGVIKGQLRQRRGGIPSSTSDSTEFSFKFRLYVQLSKTVSMNVSFRWLFVPVILKIKKICF